MNCGLRIADCGLPALRRLGEGGRISSFAKATEDGADCGLGSAGVPPAAFGVPPNALAFQPSPTCPGNTEGREPPMKEIERNLAGTVYALYYKARVHIRYE